MIGHQFVALICLAAFSFLLFRSVIRDVSRTELCDTTYINPRYERVEGVEFDEGVPYSLIRYHEVPSHWVPADVAHRPGRVAVLFVHGHLGSHEQMRSMASETAKEIARRTKQSIDVDAVDWYAADFLEEPSGLEPRLLDRQATYVTSCLRRLSSSYDKVVLLGYSMGGIVVDTVVDGLDDTEGLADVLGRDAATRMVDSLSMVVTIGSPHFHLPTFMIPNQRKRGGTRRNMIPTLRVFSGPGDVLVPSISAWSVHARGEVQGGNVVEVDLENVPGVWGTASHKGLVSCNQLVRRIVPLILDGARLASDRDVLRLFSARMTTDVRFDGTKIDENLPRGLGSVPAHSECALIDDAVQVVRVGDLGKAESPSASCFIMNLDVDSTSGTNPHDEMVQVVLHGLTPRRDVRLIAMDGDREVGDMSDMLSPLPSMSIAEPKKNKRHWKEVIGGIQWMQNSTWVVEVSTGAVRDLGATSLMLTLSERGLKMPGAHHVEGRGFTVVSVSRADRRYRALGSTVKGTSVISIDVPAIFSRSLRVVQRFIPVFDWKQLAQLVPVRLVVNGVGCRQTGISLPHSPVLVSKKDSARQNLDSDQIRTSSGAFGDALNDLTSDPTNRIDVPLWHPSLLSDTMYVIVDPTCQYYVTLRQDILPAVAYAVRYHAYALPGLLLALTMLRLVPVRLDPQGHWSPQYPSFTQYGRLVTIVAASGTLLSRVLTTWQAGSVPWLFLQTPLSIAAILWIAICLDIVSKSFICTMSNIMGYAIPQRIRLKGALIPRLRLLLMSAMLALCLLHDFAAFIFAFVSVSALAVCGSEICIGKYSVIEWGFLLASGVSPMVIALSGGKLVPYPHRETYGFLSVERLLVSFVSMGTICTFATGPTETPSRLARATLAAVATISSLFGYCFGGPFIMLILIGTIWTQQRHPQV